MEQLGDVVWEDFYDQVADREPRDEVVRAARVGRPGFAVELGCGDGTDSRFLLTAGWQVLAIDAEPGAIDRVGRLAAGLGGLTTRLARFEEIDGLPPADLIVAAYTLPFCPPDAFDRLWSHVRTSLSGGGRFSGNFFGPRDTWFGSPGMSFHDRGDLERLFAGFDIEVFDEADEEGLTAAGHSKHWHVFSVMGTLG